MSERKDLSRSEVARQRRAQRVVKELAQTSKRALRPAVTVSSRVASPDAAARKRAAKPRRFNVAVGMPDVYLRRPTAPRFHVSWRLGSVLIILLTGAALYLLLTLPFFRVANATVLGNNRLTREDIEAEMGVLGQSIFTVHPEEVETRLRVKLPELLSVKVNVYLPNHVYVTLTERAPVILWQQSEGYTWIDAEGIAFRPRGFVAGLVLVEGTVPPPTSAALPDDPGAPGTLAPAPFLQKELVDSILLLAPSVPADSKMVFDHSFGLGWTDSRGWKSYFGISAKDMPLKLRVYQTLADSLVSRGILPSVINVMYPDAPFYRVVPGTEKELTLNNGQ
jgi:hypothetical protein